ncbi:MAG: DNA repair protein RadC [Bacilli bacterium]|nr:DNA repair protein RadC [Bacilli bacterium]
MPLTERPREKLLLRGKENMSIKELIAIILKSGTKNINVNDLALGIIKKYNIDDFKDISINDLIKIEGIGKVKAITLIAAIELGKRIYMKEPTLYKKLSTPQDIFIETKYLFNNLKQEYFYCLYFNSKQELIGKKLLFMGTVNQSITHPREVFKEAYKLSASSIICIHNHPSNDITPSKADIYFTNNLVQIGKIQGIPVLDHIIIGEDKYYSFYDNNLIKD